MHVVTVCQHNAGRSQIARALLAVLRPDWEVTSAGVGPDLRGTHVPDSVVDITAELGITIDPTTPRTLLTPEHADRADVIIMLTEPERWPAWLDRTKAIYWDTADPRGQSVDVLRAARDDIATRVAAFAGDLPASHRFVPVAWDLISATDADMDEVTELLMEADRRFVLDGDWWGLTSRDHARSTLELPYAHRVVARHRTTAQLLGFAALLDPGEDEYTAHRVGIDYELVRVMVHPDYEHRGIARSLVTHLTTIADAELRPIWLACLSDTARAITLYANAGFTPVASSQTSRLKRPVTVMRRDWLS